jgi:demethylmenaquinone methyltransferase/2-methoxy-6-polyprenyl-1,4-benzoquinol methylase
MSTHSGEVSLMGFFNWAAPAFGRLADRWSAEDVETIAAPIRDALTECSCVLDVGGGTGALAARLADALEARVTVLDPTTEMTSYAPDRDDVEVVTGSAEEMPFDDDAFDAVVVSDAFHHFEDPGTAAGEMARVVRSGGIVQILELDPSRWGIRLVATAERLLREPANFYTPSEMEALMHGHGIEGSSIRHRGASYAFVGVVRLPPS